MKKILYIVLFTIYFLAFCVGYTQAQSINNITGKCSGTRNSSKVYIVSIGDIYYQPCSGRASYFIGNVDFSGATITGAVTGTGTTNYIPRWTNGASGVLGDTPFSWSGTTYTWQNTAKNSTFLLNYTPSNDGNGRFNLGNQNTSGIALDESAGGVFFYGVSRENSVTAYATNKTITPIGTTGNVTINKPFGTATIASSASSLTVTNNTVDANSIIFGVVRTNDVTCALKNIVAGSGSFVITMTANCTAATSVGFFVAN